MESTFRHSFLWLVCRGPADQSLTSSDPVDLAELLNGVLHELILAETVERRDHIELARDHVGLHKVWKGLELL